MPQLPDGKDVNFIMDWTVKTLDIDELNHVSNVTYVYWIQELARSHSNAVGLTFEAFQSLGEIFMVKRHEVEYIRPCFARDELILGTWIDGWRSASCIRHSRILRKADHKAIAEAETTWFWGNLKTGRPKRIPPQIRQLYDMAVTDENTDTFLRLLKEIQAQS